jgi:hypothetical protein
MSQRKPTIVSLVLGFGLLAGAGYFFSNTRHLLTTGRKAPGIVTGFERRSSKRGHSDYPIIEFTTATGDIHRFTTSGAGDYSKGETVNVLYDTSDPATARVDAFIELWLGSLALGGFGVLCLGVGFGTLLYERKHAKTKT